jgi:hypothetical protein
MEKEVRYLTMRPTDNGVIIQYDECVEMENKNTYDMPRMVNREESYSVKEGMKRFEELLSRYQKAKSEQD